MQDFFNDNPVLAGIIVFIVIAIAVVAIYLIIFFVTKNKRKAKKDKLLELEHQNDIQPQSEEIIEEDNNEYYILDFDNSGNLVIRKVEDGSTIKKPTKENMLSIISGNNTRLALPENKVWIFIDENNQYKPSQEIKDRNLFTYKAFLKFMSGKYDMTWAISKFI